jgi:hypothetical protein
MRKYMKKKSRTACSLGLGGSDDVSSSDVFVG